MATPCIVEVYLIGFIVEASSKDRTELECSGVKLEATDAALEPPTLTVPTKRGPHLSARNGSARSGSIIAALRAPLHQTQRRSGGGISPAHEIEHKQDRQRETDEKKCRTCGSRCGEEQRGREQHGGTARDGSAARRHSSLPPAA